MLAQKATVVHIHERNSYRDELSFKSLKFLNNETSDSNDIT